MRIGNEEYLMSFELKKESVQLSQEWYQIGTNEMENIVADGDRLNRRIVVTKEGRHTIATPMRISSLLKLRRMRARVYTRSE